MANQAPSTAPGGTESTLKELISTFSELNSSAVEELDSEPSPLELMRFVARNTPFVIHGGASSWKARQKWNSSYLDLLCKARQSTLPSLHMGMHSLFLWIWLFKRRPTYSFPEHNDTIFLAKPHEESQPFDEFLTYVIRQETDPEFPSGLEVRYAQSQNDNLCYKYWILFLGAEKDIPFAGIALQKSPDAVNL
ncbi:hypothetical protein TOPH_01709 [Tolypocladium ophioglossoides CBS 100239]|uniref:Cupin-like domain-containing protein n=1 Tax=Tolypocladium ophioglossoides (strain CBS 100239) TaxID=1163406 RepID=A0A0L0NIJ9_TOLOC|nr:hypothetical protein TOPH_01709 [Tolypocladium ophioglossoides CBS 100239]